MVSRANELIFRSLFECFFQPPVNNESDESAAMAAPTFAQMARLLLEQQMDSS